MTERSIDRAKMLTALSCRILRSDQVSDILNNPIEFPATLVEVLAIETTLAYWNGLLSYEAANCIMNNLYSFWINNEYYKTYSFTEVAWECYEAFDAGEYYRHDDDRSISPEEKYTRPLVEELLRKRKLIA